MGVINPAFDDFKVGFDQAEPFFNSGKFQQTDDLHHPESTVGEIKQCQKSVKHTVFSAGALIRYAKRYAQFFVGLGIKNRMHEGRIGFNVRCHNNDISGR